MIDLTPEQLLILQNNRRIKKVAMARARVGQLFAERRREWSKELEQIKDLKKALMNAGVVARRAAHGDGMEGTLSQSPRNSRERTSPRWYKRLVKS